MPQSVKQTLEAAASLIRERDKWTQGELARDDSNQYVDWDSARACCFCALGAILRVTPKHENRSEARQALAASCHALYKIRSISSINDTLGHSAILKAYDHAINQADS